METREMLAILSLRSEALLRRVVLVLALGMACSASASDNPLYLDWTGSMDVPGWNGHICWSGNASGAPVGAYVTEVTYVIEVDDRGILPGNFWCSDYEIYLSNDTHGGSDYKCVWNHEGGKTDEGADDDAPDDSDIALWTRGTTAFSGENPNQKWYVCVKDNRKHNILLGVGRLTEARLRIFWHLPEPDLCDKGEVHRSFSPQTVVLGKEGQDFEVNCIIGNIGGASAGNFVVSFYLSSDTSISTSDYFLGDKTIFGLTGHTPTNCDFSRIFPLHFPPPGTYYVGWIIDRYNAVDESDEDNNTAYVLSQQLTVMGAGAADLCDGGESYRSFSPETVEQGKSGQHFTICCHIDNDGGAPSEPCKLVFYASADNHVNRSDYLIGSKTLQSISANGSVGITFITQFPTSIPAGEYYIGWIIDVDDEVDESNETNNTAYKHDDKLTVSGVGPGVQVPDVVGMAQAEAESAIVSAGLVVGAISYDYSDTVPEGYVISQDPAAGTQVSNGSTVDIVISVGSAIDGLIAYWKLDETAGAIAYDSAGAAHGTLYGNPVWQPTDGIIDGALLFDGVDDYVDLPIGSLISSLTDCTVATWVNWSGQTGGLWQRIFDFGTGEDINMFLTPSSDVDGPMRFAITTEGYGEDRSTAPYALASGWHHVAVTIGTGSAVHTLYLDGQVAAQNAVARFTPSDLGETTQNWLGRSQYSWDAYYSGMLDDFRIYDRALSVNEILYLAGYGAAVISVENFSFELPGDGKIKGWDMDDGAYYVDTSEAAEVPGWESDGMVVDSGVESDWPGSTEGDWSGFLMSGDPSTYQTTDHIIAAGEEFLLQVDARENWSETPPALLEVSLYADAFGQRAVLVTETLEILPSDAEQPWATYTLGFAADTMAMLQGFPIGIELSNAQESNSWIGIDNVRLCLGVLPPEPVCEAVHSYMFEDGTANDSVGSAHGTLIGDATIASGSLVLDGDGDWMEMPGDVIAMNTYSEISIEAWFTSVAGGNTDYHMLAAFGEEGTGASDSAGYKYLFITPARGDDVSRAAIQTSSMDDSPWDEESNVDDIVEHDDGIEHHFVATVNATHITFYIDGELIGSTALAESNEIAGISQSVAYLGKSVYPADPLWAGSIEEFNIYNKALTLAEVEAKYALGPIR
jgi:hypothetical protein